MESDLNLDHHYEVLRDEKDIAKKTLLHYAAELGFLHVAKTIMRKCPLLLVAKTKQKLRPIKKRCLLPVELALIGENDGVAAYLIRMMWPNRYLIVY